MKILLVGGLFHHSNDGEISFAAEQLVRLLRERNHQVEQYNGGHISYLSAIISKMEKSKLIIWMPTIEENYGYIKSLEKLYPKKRKILRLNDPLDTVYNLEFKYSKGNYQVGNSHELLKHSQFFELVLDHLNGFPN